MGDAGDAGDAGLLRYFTLGKDLVRVGFLAQSPAGEGCAATFDHIMFRPGRGRTCATGVKRRAPGGGGLDMRSRLAA